MVLAQVVYQASTDADFAEQVRVAPEVALAERGYRLSAFDFEALRDILSKTEKKIIALAERVSPRKG